MKRNIDNPRKRKKYRTCIVWFIVAVVLVSCDIPDALGQLVVIDVDTVIRAQNSIPNSSIRVIDDEELFELLAGRPVAEVGRGDNRRIILLDQK